MSEFKFVPGDVIVYTTAPQMPVTVTALGEICSLGRYEGREEEAFMKFHGRGVWVRYVKPEDPLVKVVDDTLAVLFDVGGAYRPGGYRDRLALARSIVEAVRKDGL